MNTLSLFDGMSCGQIALERLAIPVENYFACEIDKHAIKVSQKKWPGMVHLGSVVGVHAKDLPRIDIIIGGSPCQGFSRSGKGLNFDDPRSKLFFEFVRLYHECREINPDVQFMLENVRMKKEWEDIISRYLEIQPIFINSTSVSAQNRERLYWTNISMKKRGLFDENYCSIPQPKDRNIFLESILEDEVDKKYYLSERMIKYVTRGKVDESSNEQLVLVNQGRKKINPMKSSTLTSSGCGLNKQMDIIVHNTMPRSSKTKKGGTGPLSRTDGKSYCLDTGNTNAIQINNKFRRFTPVEVCRLQTVPDNYFFDNTCGGGGKYVQIHRYTRCVATVGLLMLSVIYFHLQNSIQNHKNKPMKRTHLIYGEKIIIDWEKSERIERHDSGCSYFLLIGEGDDGNEYEAVGIYQGDELQEIENIQTI